MARYNYDYVRKAYGVDPKIGQRVTHNGKGAAGVIAHAGSSGHYVRVKFDGEKFASYCHPTDLDYAPLPHSPVKEEDEMSVIDEIAVERRRQIEKEGWTAEHDDDEHNDGELGLAAACYAAPKRVFIAETYAGRGYESYVTYEDAWPWADHWWKPTKRRRNLIKAAALIVAEIERLDRAALSNPTGSKT